MEPNTSSPHLLSTSTPGANVQCEPFVKYEANAVSAELKSSLTNFVQAADSQLKTIGADESRDVLYYGEYSYRYTGGQHEAMQMPKEIQDLVDYIKPQLPNPDVNLNSCLISRYKTGANSIPPRRDTEPIINPESDIITILIDRC